jgi:hypothetical protein
MYILPSQHVWLMTWFSVHSQLPIQDSKNIGALETQQALLKGLYLLLFRPCKVDIMKYKPNTICTLSCRLSRQFPTRTDPSHPLPLYVNRKNVDTGQGYGRPFPFQTIHVFHMLLVN